MKVHWKANKNSSFGRMRALRWTQRSWSYHSVCWDWLWTYAEGWQGSASFPGAPPPGQSFADTSRNVRLIGKGPYTWSKRDISLWPSCKWMPSGSGFCLENLGNLFDKGTFIWDGGSFIWQEGTFIWQEGTFILRRVTAIRVAKFWSCVRSLSELVA